MVDLPPDDNDLMPMMAESRSDIIAVMRALPASIARPPRPMDIRVPERIEIKY